MTTSDYLTQLQQDREDLVDNLETQGITGLTGDETFTELVPEVLNIQGGADLSDYFTSSISSGTSSAPGFAYMIKSIPNTTVTSGTSLDRAFAHFRGTSIPLIDTSNITSMSYMFYKSNIETCPQFDTSNVTNMSNMFNGSSLTNLPVLNTSKIISFQSFVASCILLTASSLDNILQMCIGASSYQGTKTLVELGFSGRMQTTFPTSTIQALPHYQDFIDAGWQIGY